MTVWARDQNDIVIGTPSLDTAIGRAEWIGFEIHAASALMDRADTFVEVGCADGCHLKIWTEEFPEKTFIGFDAPVLVEMARDHVRGAHFIDDWVFLVGVVRAEQGSGRMVGLILSSSLDEVFFHSDVRTVPEVGREDLERLFDVLAYVQS